MAAPKLSVVVASDNTAPRTRECLAALRAQTVAQDMEIIVADCSSDGTVEAIEQEAPEVKVIRFPQRVPLARLLATGLRSARGEFIAILESRGVPEAGWAEAALQALRQPSVAVGGPVEWAGHGEPVEWAAYFCDYGQFMRPRPAGPVAELPGNNCAFPRAWLTEYPEHTQPSFWKTFFLWQCQERGGIRLIFVPAMVVHYQRPFPSLADFLTRRFHHARCFGAMRRPRLSTPQRWLYTLLAPLLPPLLVWRILRRLWPKRQYRAELWRSLPFIMIASWTWAIGEWVGYVAGEEDSCGKTY